MAYQLAMNVRRLKQREYLKTVQDDLHSLELYYKEGRTVKLLMTSHEPGFFGEEQWAYFQKKSSKLLKKKVKLGKSKSFRLGKDKQLNCSIVAWPNGLSAICITSRGPNLEMPQLDEGITDAARSAELKFLSTVIDVSSRRKLASNWAKETRVLDENKRLKKQCEILNRYFQDELVEVGNQVDPISRKKKGGKNIFAQCVNSLVDE